MSRKIHQAFSQAKVHNSDLNEKVPDPLFVSPPEEHLFKLETQQNRLSPYQR